MTKLFVTHEQVQQAAEVLISKFKLIDGLKFYGVPRGGVAPAYLLAGLLNGQVVNNPIDANVIVDDLIDSGATLMRLVKLYPNKVVCALFDKGVERINPEARAILSSRAGQRMPDQWLVMPWEVSDEHDASAEDSVVRMLQAIGENPGREGLLETPRRVVKAWGEWFSGYSKKPEDFMKTFEDGAEGCDEMVLLTDIPVFSHCEHHLAPFIGTAHVAYVPNGKIVGLSKIPKVVDMFARRLQVQERLTNQVADCLVQHLNPLGVAVVIKAKHFCMATRGVKMPNVETTTSAMRGVFFDNPSTRAEFMSLIK